MRILLDECVDGRLARDIAGHRLSTVHQMNWTGIRNGDLLALASAEFDVFITVDRNLHFQQNVVLFDIAVVVLHARTNRLADLRPLVSSLLTILPDRRPGEVRVIGTV